MCESSGVNGMSIAITVKNVYNGSTIRMEVENDETMGDIIKSAAEYWRKEASAYILKKGKMLLRSSMTVAEAGIITDDVLEMIPDPEGGSR